jgi:hypothetical protein
MKRELNWMITVLGLGFSLVAYAHMTFMTKEVGHLILDELKVIKSRVYDNKCSCNP